MQVFLMPKFIADLQVRRSPHFAQRVLDQLFDGNGQFRIGKNDHRFQGMADAWIRYVSKGKSAYRIIYFRKGEKIFLYRAGEHSIEENLFAPTDFVGTTIRDLPSIQGTAKAAKFDYGEILVTQPKLNKYKTLRSAFLEMFHVAHNEITFITPFLSRTLLDQHSEVGGFCDKAIEEGTAVTLITRPPKDTSDLLMFEGIAAREIFVFFCAGLHAKLYLFDVNMDSLSRYQKERIDNVAILGSSNLTRLGTGFGNVGVNEELCFRPPRHLFEEFKQYSYFVINKSTDFESFRARFRRF